MVTGINNPYVPPTTEVVEVMVEGYILQLSSFRESYGDEFEIW